MSVYKEVINTSKAVSLAKKAGVSEPEMELEKLKQGVIPVVKAAESTWITCEESALYLNGLRSYVKIALGYSEGGFA